MAVRFINAWGYQGDAMNLPVANVSASVAFYVEKMGFELEGHDADAAVRFSILSRPDVRMRLIESGGDPKQDGCAFEVSDIAALRQEFTESGLETASEITDENREGSLWKVFFVTAPDGLCYWFGQRMPA